MWKDLPSAVKLVLHDLKLVAGRRFGTHKARLDQLNNEKFFFFLTFHVFNVPVGTFD